MFPSPRCPRAGQSGLWQNWACGSNGDPPGARFGDHARRDARWTRAFQASTILTTVPWGATPASFGHAYPGVLRSTRGIGSTPDNRGDAVNAGIGTENESGGFKMDRIGPPWSIPR